MPRKWISSAGAVAVCVAATVVIGVAYHANYGGLSHEDPYTVETPELAVHALEVTDQPDLAALAQQLASGVADPDLGTLSARVVDATSGTVLLDQASTTALRPASTTKLLTAAAAILELGAEDRITTEVVAAPEDSGSGTGLTAVIRAAGDVWLTEERVSQLAEQLADYPITGVAVDTSAWTGSEVLDGWNEEDIDAGYVAPLQPIMLYGGRIGATSGDVPRSHTPALDVAQALADALGVANEGEATAPQAGSTTKKGGDGDADEVSAGQVLATTQSPTLASRLAEMMADSDNVMAEAIGRELAVQRGAAADDAGAPASVLATLAEHSLDLAGVELQDCSGLSVNDLIPAGVLEELLREAVTGTELRELLAPLPVGGASGTLDTRYTGESAGRGWVRAKTGTLDETSGLAGYITGESGHTYTFAFISNNSPILTSRAALDELVSGLREDLS